MLAYIFLHFGRSSTASGFTVRDFPDDAEALDHAQELLTREGLSGVEIYADQRPVGVLSRDRSQPAFPEAPSPRT